jgi:hypothetical protein
MFQRNEGEKSIALLSNHLTNEKYTLQSKWVFY